MSSIKTKITQKTLKGLDDNRPAKGQSFIRDSQLKGFAVKLTPSGCSYIVEGRVKGSGQVRRLVLGKVALMGLEDARHRARQFLLELGQGIDPVLPASPPASVPTFGEALDLYLSERPLRESSKEQYRRQVPRALARWVDLPVDEITEDMAKADYLQMVNRAPGLAIKVFKVAHAVLRFASAQPRYRNADGTRMLATSPVAVLSELGIKRVLSPRKDYLNEAELVGFGTALNEVENTTHRNLLKFLLLTGMRLNEARRLMWHEVNMLSRVVTLSAERVKTKVGREVPLTIETYEIIADQARSRSVVCDYVFPCGTGTAPANEVYLRRDWKKLREKLNRPNLKIHGLRRTYTTMASAPGIMAEFELKMLIGHRGDITAGYRQISTDALRAPAQRATAHIAKSMTRNEVDTETICSR